MTNEAMRFSEIKQFNHWGTIYFLPAEQKKHDYEPGKTDVLRFNAGQILTLQFPNGEIGQHEVKIKKQNNYESGQGYAYNVVNEIPGIELKHKGLTFFVPLTDLKVASHELSYKIASKAA